MTPLERLNEALRIRKALDALMTPEEADTYSACLGEHLQDYINDLLIDYQEDQLDQTP
jgi:hypothetical protein